MKKFVATLLFFIFANSFFAGAFASSISGETLNLKVDSQTVKNLHSAVDVFEKTYNDFCDGRTIALCQEKFSGAFPNSAELKRTNYDEKNAKRFFELIAGFYNDLQNFNSEKNTIGSKEKDDLRAQIMAKKAKRLSELSELVKKVNEERGLLDDLDGKKRDQLTKENETTLTSLGLNKYDGDLDGYKDNGVEQHNLKDNIDLSKIPEPAIFEERTDTVSAAVPLKVNADSVVFKVFSRCDDRSVTHRASLNRAEIPLAGPIFASIIEL